MARDRRAAEALDALRASFRNPGLRALQLAWAACSTADLAQDVALGVYIFTVQGVTGLGIVGLVRALPAGLLAPLVASVVDRHDRRRVLGAILVLRAALLGSQAAILLSDGPVAAIYLLTAADAMVYTLYWPAQSSLMLDLAHTPQELTAANVAATTVENVGVLVGPTLAGVLLAVSAPGTVLAASAGLVGLGVVAIVAVRPAAPHTRAPTEPVLERLFGGFRALWRDHASLAVVSLYLVQILCLGALSALVVVTSLELLGVGQAGVGYLTAVVGAGGVAGSVAALGLVGRRLLTPPFRVALGLWGLALALLALAPELVVAVGSLAVAGAAAAVVDVSAVNLLQRMVPDRVLGRVLGVVEGAWWAMFGLGSMGAAALVDVTGPRMGLAAAAGAAIAASAIGVVVLRPVDARALPPERELAALRAVPMLSAQPPLALERLALKLQPLDLAAGEEVLKRGEMCDRFYVVDTGTLMLEPGATRLGPGDWFGEAALVGDAAGAPTVRAMSAARLFVLERADFVRAVTAHPVTGGFATGPAGAGAL